MATTDAPVYFNGPVQIEDSFYVDGGLGGNCPLKQAIPTALELFGDDANLLVVSLAPPSPSPGQIPTGVMQQIVYWLQYFPRWINNPTHVGSHLGHHEGHPLLLSWLHFPNQPSDIWRSDLQWIEVGFLLWESIAILSNGALRQKTQHIRNGWAQHQIHDRGNLLMC